MPDPPVQAQWSLDRTASSLVTTTLGTLAAFASDNVHPIAYVACEKLGATLAISDSTARKIQRDVIPPTTPAPVAFLKAQVGFFANDSATLLGQSQAGVRFLALAAAITTTLQPFDAARAVEAMLQPLSSDPTVLPSTRNIKTLLASLEPRCHRAGFANEVLGWQLLLERIAVPLLDVPDGFERPFFAERLLTTAPSAEMVDRLVDAFRQLERVGPSTVSRVTICIGSAVPWVMAFAKWSLGAPPHVRFDGQAGEEILASPDSQVTLLIPKCEGEMVNDGGIRVAIHHSISGPHELLAPPSTEIWAGMVPINTYGQLMLQSLGFEADFPNRVLHEALRFAILQCLELLCMSMFVREGLQGPMIDERKKIDESLASRRFSPLPNRRSVAAAYRTLFSLHRLPELRTFSASALVHDCPLVRIYLEELKRRCECSDCSAERGSQGEFMTGCECDHFYSRLGRATATILALSLFDAIFSDPDSLLFCVPLPHPDVAYGKFEEAIGSTLVHGESPKVQIVDLIEKARGMIGHERPELEFDVPIMTSSRGQVMFPAFLERRHIATQGSMTLFCLPGVLKHGNGTYREAGSGAVYPGHIAPLKYLRNRSSSDTHSLLPVVAPLNLFPFLQAGWELTKVDDDRLVCKLMLGSKEEPGPLSRMHLDPLRGLRGLMYGLHLETCPHSPQTALDQADEFSKYCGPLDPLQATGSDVAVVAVDGNDDLRMVAVNQAQLEGDKFYVLRGNACLGCCLKLCRLAGVNRLIL